MLRRGMVRALTSGLIAGYGIAVPVGAIAVLIVTKGATESLPAGVAAGLGAASADLTYATVALACGAAIRPDLSAATSVLHLTGGAVLAAIALRGLWTALRRPVGLRAAPSTGSLATTYVRFLGLTLVNPLTIVYFTTIVVTSRAVEHGLNAVAFVGGVAIASASWQLVLAAGGALLGRAVLTRSALPAALVGNGIILALAARQLALFYTTR